MKKYLKNIMAGTMVFEMAAALAGCGSNEPAPAEDGGE